MLMGGILYLVATPIGNLEDITARALRILREADLIAAEDTRRTRQLLNYYQIEQKLISYHRHNQKEKGPLLIECLKAGKKIALVSDAGTPGISDPGAELVRSAVEAGIEVAAVPGPSAIIAAITVSGLDTRRFVFEGFLPRRSSERRKRAELLAGEERTVVIFEAPHRLLETLRLLAEVWGPRQAAVAREITKCFEEVVRGTLPELAEHFQAHPPRGEFTLVVAGRGAPGARRAEGGSEGAAGGAEPGGASGADSEEAEPLAETIGAEAIKEEIEKLLAGGASMREAVRALAAEKKIKRQAIYRLLSRDPG